MVEPYIYKTKSLTYQQFIKIFLNKMPEFMLTLKILLPLNFSFEGIYYKELRFIFT